MPALSLARMKSRITNRVVGEDKDGADDDILENLSEELPPTEYWEVELLLETLALG